MPRTFDRWTPRNDKDPNRFGLDYTDPQSAIDTSVTRSALRIRDNFPQIIKDTTGVDLTDKAQTRSVLGLAYGTAAGTVAQGNDSRIVGAEQASNRGAANGYAPLNSLGKIDITFLPAPATTSFVSTVLTGNDDVTTVFTLSQPAAAPTQIEVYRNGLREVYGVGFTATSTTLTFTTAPLTTDTVAVTYQI